MILFFDTETTGKLNMRLSPEDPSQPNLVQLGAILMAEGGQICGTLDCIVEPNGWEISEEVALIHRIPQALAVRAGIPRRSVLSVFNHMCKHARLIVAHNIEFDWQVMEVQYHREGVPHRMAHLKKICTMKAATPVCKIPKPFKPSPRDPYKWPSLLETYQFLFGADKIIDSAHSAIADCQALVEIYLEMKKRGLL